MHTKYIDLLIQEKKLNETHGLYFPDSYYSESVTRDGNDIFINLENFENQLFNFILVIGLPGSGKGTISRRIREKFPATEHIELDLFDQCYNMTEAQVKKMPYPVRQYILEEPQGQRYYKTGKTLSINEKITANHDFILYMISYCKANKHTVFILDGTPIYGCMEPEEISNYPIFIKGTSADESYGNKVKRDKNDNSDSKKLHSSVSKKTLDGLLDYYYDDERYLKKFVKALVNDEDVNSVE